jgi:hypothetical protein
LEVRSADDAFRITMNGSAGGSVERNTRRNTASAPHPSEALRRARVGGSSRPTSRRRLRSIFRFEHRGNDGRHYLRDQSFGLLRRGSPE